MDEWQLPIERHIELMERSYSEDAETRRNDEQYLAGCSAFLGHLNTTYGSIEDLNKFLKAVLVEESGRRAARYNVEENWNDIQKTDDLVDQTEEIIDIYENVFKKELEELENLPRKRGAFNPPLPSP